MAPSNMTLSLRMIPKLSAALFMAAFALLLIPSYFVLIMTAAVGTAAGVALLYLSIDEPYALRFSWLMGATLLIAYSGGTFSTWFSSLSFEDFTILTKQRPIELLSGALALVYISTGFAIAVGRFESPILRPDDKLPSDSGFGVLLSLIGLSLIICAYLIGDIGFEGIQIDPNSQRIPVLGATVILITPALAGLFGFLYGRFKQTVLKTYYVVGGIAVIASIIPTGRRQIVLALIMLVLGYSISGGLRQRSRLQKLLIGTAIISIGFFVSAYFFAMRLSVWELGPTSTLVDQMTLAFQFLTSPTLEERFNALLYENLRERTFVLGYLADLIEATKSSGPLYGEALLFYLRLSIPSVLDPSKVDVLAIQQIESFAHPKLGLPVIDQANTILTDGVTDFGVLGGFVYLLGMIAVLCAVVWLLRQFYRSFTFMITSLTLFNLAMRPEITLSEYIVTIRNLIWIVPLIFVGETIWNSTLGYVEPDLYDLHD
jgi:hypothetical protein